MPPHSTTGVITNPDRVARSSSHLALVDRLAQDREVILLANRGVGASTGVVPDNVTDMTRDVLSFVDTLGLGQIDLLDSRSADISRRTWRWCDPVSSAGSCSPAPPTGAPKIHRWSDDVYALRCPRRARRRSLRQAVLLRLGGEPCKGHRVPQASLSPARRPRPGDGPRDPRRATGGDHTLGIPDPSKLARLAAITQPTLVANGDNDTMMITENSYVLAHHLPNAQPRIYPDASHGFLDQSQNYSLTTSTRFSTAAERNPSAGFSPSSSLSDRDPASLLRSPGSARRDNRSGGAAISPGERRSSLSVSCFRTGRHGS